jgi:sugar lactone lactonase YvrE
VNVPAGYQLAGGTGTVIAGGSLTFNVTLQAVAAGTYGGNLTVTSSAPGLGTFTIPITGLVLAPPAVTTLAATAVTATSATLNATINPEDSSTTGWFEWSPDPEFDGVAVTTLAGSTAGDVDGPAATARFNQPTGVASDHLGNRYIADSKNHRIRKIAPDGTVSTVAGTGVAGFAEGLGNVAQFNEPIGVVLNAAGVLFVTDSKNHRIRAISTGGNVTTLAGLGEPGFTDGVGTAARFSTPQGLALSADGSLLVADRDNHRIRKVSPDGTVSTFVGTGTAGALNGAANVAQFSSPQAIATGLAGVVFVTETTSHAIRKIAADGATSVFAGAVAAAGFLEGVGVAARFANPVGVTVDANGDLFVADRGNHRIRKIAGDGAVSTFAGTAVAGLVDGPGETAQFNQPVALAVTGPGALVVGELGLSTIRRLAPTRVVMQAASNLTGGDDLPMVLPISGLAAATTYYFRAFATNGGGTTYGAILSFGGAASQSPFQSWQTDQFGEDASNETISGPLASPSKDGVSNLLKYAFGLDPHEPATGGLPTTALVGGQLTLTYTQVLAATDLDYTPEWSNDLITWSAEGITEGIIGSPPPGSPTQQVRASIPMGAAKAKFIRLNVRIQQP